MSVGHVGVTLTPAKLRLAHIDDVDVKIFRHAAVKTEACNPKVG